MKNMRRFCAMLLALAVMLGALPAMAAGMTILREDESVSLNHMAYYDSTLYLFDWELNYYTWTKDGGMSEKQTVDRGEYSNNYNYSEDDEDRRYYDISGIVAGEDGLYCILYSYDQEYDPDEEYYVSAFDETTFRKLEPNSDGVLAISENGVELEWDDMIESYGDDEYNRSVDKPMIIGGKLVFSTYTDNGTAIGVYDIESGEGEIVEPETSFESFCAYKDGVLMLANDYQSDNGPKFVYFDLETLETEELGDAVSVDYYFPSNLAYSEENDTLYYTLNGQLWSMTALDAASAKDICAVQTGAWSNFSAAILTDDGDYICGDYETVILRSVDPSDRPATSISVYTGYNSAMDDAYYAFTAANSDVEVVKISSMGDVTQAMMNKSDSVDVYTMSLTADAYNAVFERGYMAELSDSQIISDTVKAMYPAIQDVVTKDGVIYGVPISMYVNSNLSYDAIAFENAGLTEDDVPVTLMDFIKLLQRMPEILETNEDINVFASYMTVDDVRWSIFYDIIGLYGMYMQTGDVEMSYNTDTLRELLAEFEKIDFSAMGLLEEYSDDYAYVGYEEHKTLFENYSDITCRRYVLDDAWKALLLTIDEGVEPVVDCGVEIAFVNPFSKNRDLAIEYIENAVAELDQIFLTETCPGVNEPVRNPYYEENLAYYEEQLASMRAEMEKASDEEKEQWQRQINELEEYRDEFTETQAWDVTEESIATYRQYGDCLYPTRSMGLEGDAAETYYEQLQQYMEGNISADEMLKNIDDKLRMMLLEDM